MHTVHFTQLQHLAVRGPLERGLRYAFCHNRTPELCSPYPYYEAEGSESYDKPNAFADEYVVASGIQYLNYMDRERRESSFSGLWTQKHKAGEELPDVAYEPQPMFSYYYRRYRGVIAQRFLYAADAGLWEVPEVDYKSKLNFVLDVHALLREGIKIDLTPRRG